MSGFLRAACDFNSCWSLPVANPSTPDESLFHASLQECQPSVSKSNHMGQQPTQVSQRGRKMNNNLQRQWDLTSV